MTPANIDLCGELRIEFGERLDEGLPRGQIRILLAYLVLSRERPVTRQTLAGVLWDEQPPSRWDVALSALLSRLRRHLAPRIEIAGRGELRLLLPADAAVDFELAEGAARQAEEAIARGDARAAREPARRALAIADRGFLPGQTCGWAEERQRELEGIGLRALESAAAAGTALGGDALAAGERAAVTLIERDPLGESGYRHLIAAQQERGDIAGALRTFDRLRTRLREDLGTVPSADLLAIHRELLGLGADGGEEPAAPAPIPGPAVASGSLVGRTEQLAEMRQGWRQAQAGRMSVILVSGEAGIGKTRLCAELATRIGRQGAAVLYGRCDEEAVTPFQPFVEALAHHLEHTDAEVLARQLDGGGGELARLLPQLGRALPDLPPPLRGRPGSDRYRLFEEATALVRGLSRERPVLLVLDDLHWADAATVAMLRQLLRGWRSSRVLVVATYRPTELEPERPFGRLLDELPRELTARRCDLRGLDREEVAGLVAQLARREPPQDFARRLHAETAGNPFFVREVLRHLLERRIVDPQDGVWPGDAGGWRAGVPESVAATIGRRLDRLAPPTNLALRRAAVIGREFPTAVLAAVCDGELELPPALDEAAAAGVIEPRGEPARAYAFSHALVHEAIYGSIGAAERGAVHLRVGEAYESLPEERDLHETELARHFRLAVGPGAVERAIEHSVAAGRHAAGRLAYEEAVEHFAWAAAAVERAGRAEEELAEILLELGRAQNRAGDSTRAKRTLERAAELASAGGRPDLLCRAALGYAGPWLELGTVEPRRLQLLEEALEMIGPEDSSERAALTARLALEVYYSGPERRERLSREAVEVARRLGDGAALARTLMSRRVAISGSPDLEQRLAVSDELIELAQRSGAHEMELWGRVWRAADHLERADVDAAYREFDEYAELAGRLRQPAFLWQPPLFAAMRALYEGRLDEIEGLMGEGLAIGARAHDPNAANYIGILGFMLRREQGRLAEVEQAVEGFVARYPAVPAWRCGLLLLDVEIGREERASKELDKLAADGFAGLPRDINWLPAMAWLALAAGRLEAADHAATLYALLEPSAERCVVTGHPIFCLGSASHHLGVLARTMGRPDLACAHLEVASATNERMRAPALLAHTRHQHGIALRERGAPGDDARGAALLALAEAEAERMGLAALASSLDSCKVAAKATPTLGASVVTRGEGASECSG